MKDPILLVIQDPSLRQLYHELIVPKGVEVVPVCSLEDVLLLQSIRVYGAIVIYADDIPQSELEIYITLQKKVERLGKSKILFLTSCPDEFSSILRVQDILIDLRVCSPTDIVTEIVNL